MVDGSVVRRKVSKRAIRERELAFSERKREKRKKAGVMVEKKD